jgi:hypothetical protein
MKYAIQIQLAVDDWIYVTEPDGTMFEVRPVLFDSFEDADKAATIWRIKGKEACVQVVKYDN